MQRSFHSVSKSAVMSIACLLAMLLVPAVSAQNEPVRILAFGAHPDDCDLGAGGLAAKYAALGYKVSAQKRRKRGDVSASNMKCSTTTTVNSYLR
jgi:hypothetical protein